MSRRAAMLATHRFGLGPRSGEVDSAASDPRGWLRAQFARPQPTPQAFETLAPSSENVVAFLDAYRVSVAELVESIRGPFARLYVREARARLAAAVASEAPFAERLVGFWSNHLTVSGVRSTVIGMCGGYEREAIRPHIAGSFREMLHAAIHHPAMLLYLDNAGSVGSNAPSAGYLDRGLNENLAREILELHTLGVDAGYRQDDVIELAKMLTGWTFQGRTGRDPGGFLFTPGRHEPGPKSLLGESYAHGGIGEAEAALDRLARHPATARRIAVKLARHFIAPDPPGDLVAALETAFRDSDGDLKALYEVLIEHPAAWAPELRNVKPAFDYVVALNRALPGAGDAADMLTTLRGFGQRPFMAPSPAGWPEAAEDWITPDSILRRVRYAADLAARHGGGIDLRGFMNATVGDLAADDVKVQLAQAESAGQAIALILASPIYQRR